MVKRPKQHFRYFEVLQSNGGDQEQRPVASLAALTIERSICLDAAVRGERLMVARLHDGSNSGIAGALAGRPLDEVPVLAGRLFPVCGTAHACGSVAAIETALGVALSPAQHLFRELLLVAEHGVSAAWRLCMDWPVLLGEPPNLRAFAEIRRAGAMIQAIAPREEWARIGGAHLRLDRAALSDRAARLVRLLQELFPEAVAQSLSDLEAEITRCANVPSRLIRAARALPPEYGAHDCRTLSAGDARAFVALQKTTPAEAGPLAAARDPLAAKSRAQWGGALASRLLAAALDAYAIAAHLEAVVAELGDDEPVSADRSQTGQGSAVVETARGPLAYHVEVADGRATSVSNLAPTGCNFHPRGPFMRALALAPQVADPVFAARLLAASFDPCAPFTLSIADAQPTSEENLCNA